MTLRVAPGQLRIHARSRAVASPVVAAGEGVSDSDIAFWRRQLTAPRYSFCHAIDPSLPADLSLFEEFVARGYDLSTFKLSIFKRGTAPKVPRPRVPRQAPGLLTLRWGWVDYDHTPDLVCGWMHPCQKADCNLVLGAVSRPNMTLLQRLGRQTGPNLMKALDERGFDVRTLRLEIRHAGAGVKEKSST